MKSFYLKIIYFIAFQFIGLWVFSQQKDSVVPKTAEIKEETGVVKKRKYTYFISDRISDDDKYDIFKITPSSHVPALIVIRGHMEVIGNANQKKAKIMVYNASNNALIGIYNTSSYTGNYLLILVPNVKYLFKVDISGYGITEQIVEVPLKIDFEICQQELKVKLNEKNKPVLMINSFFADDNEKVFYLKVTPDTTKAEFDNSFLSNNDGQNGKNGKSYANIDELVKKETEEEKKKPEEALKAFKNNDFEKALVLYSDLLKNDTEEPFINYYYGVCLLKLDKNKARAINSLRIASAIKEMPYDVFLQLGQACHLSYLFNDAISALEEYKKRAKPNEVESNRVANLIKNCQNGNVLLNDQSSIEVIKRNAAETENIVSNYDPDIVNEKLKQKTEFFYSSIDKKKQEKFLMCNNSVREFYHVSYGEKDGSNTDLYKNVHVAGTLGGSTSLGPEINTPYDENYPYLSKDGNTLYFSSKGHNSMGGYDIFKCNRKDSLSAWSRPVNMGYPINSVYDDILYIPDPASQYASYCTNRKNNSLEYVQIKLPQHPSAHSIIKGNFSTTDSIPKHEGYITITNSNTGDMAGSYKTNPITGHYLMVLVSGLKYDMVVESEGNPEMHYSFELPDKKGEFDLKQIIKIQTKLIPKNIAVSNYFTEAEAAKISLDNLAPKATTVTTKVAAAEVKKDTKPRKPRRTPEEAAKDQEDLKLARNLFDQTTYQEAALLYQELNYYIDLDPTDSYNYGISLYHAKKDKTDCITALEIAATLKTAPIDVYYHLAKAHHMSYRFNTAINYYKKFMSVCDPADIQKLNIEKEINYCNNGIKLVNNPVVLEVYSKRHVGHESIQNSLTEIESGAKILVITDDMRSSIDKKKNFKSLLFLTADKSTVLYSSYGENEANGKDIYQLKKLGNGKWSPIPQNITNINSTFDEEYPSLSKDGKTLYFSSKGYENMGDYDIFKSTWDDQTQTWSKPVNLGSPINSPFEDIYFLE